MIERFGTFIHAYHEAIKKILNDKSPELFPFHGESTGLVLVAQAADGFLVTYQPFPPHETGISPGTHGIDYSDYTLNTLCQSFSAGYLRIAYPEIGAPFRQIGQVPDLPQNEVIPDSFGCLLNPEVGLELKRRVDDKLPSLSLPVVQASPVVHYEQGITREIVPCRFKLWSPVVEIPRLGHRRLYHWTHADLWWFPERLALNSDHAYRLAFNDTLALQAVLGGGRSLLSEQSKQDTNTHAADILDAQCAEFDSFLDNFGHNEEAVHQWLKTHNIFLDLDHKTIFSKVPFGNKTSDFVVKCSDNRYKLIEIERPNLRVFTKSRSEPSTEFNHACLQVRDWQRYIRDNVHTVRIEQKLDGIYEPRGVVIMGRSKDIDTEEAKTRWYDMKNNHEHDVFTFDEIGDRVRSLSMTLRRLRTDL